MAGRNTIVYTQTRIELPEYIKSTIKAYEILGIHNTNIWTKYKAEFEKFLKTDLEWVKFAKNPSPDIGEFLCFYFREMTNWLGEWNQKEKAMAGSNTNMLNDFVIHLKNLKMAFLAVILHRSGSDIVEFANLAKSTYDAYPDGNLENLIVAGKKDYFRSNVWGSGDSMNWNEFIRRIESDLHKFCGGISKVYEKEIKKHLRIQENIMFGNLDSFFNYIWGSMENFTRFINRNYLYGQIEAGLANNLTDYQRIQSEYNIQIPALKLNISKCNFGAYLNREYLLEIDGIQDSERFVGDKIVTFGKEFYEEFSNDISLPNMNQLDSIFAFIYTNSNGFNLVDISQNGVVRVKVGDSPVEIVDGMIIIFGITHAFEINFVEGPFINGRKTKIPVISGSSTCSITKNFMAVQPANLEEPFTIGKHQDNKLMIDFKDISEQHASIYWNREKNKWFLADGSIQNGPSKNGTFYKLKTKKEIDQKTPSSALLLELFTAFMIEGFLFIALKP